MEFEVNKWTGVRSHQVGNMYESRNRCIQDPRLLYWKASSFFDNISCEATDRAAEVDRPKVDREKAREYDKADFHLSEGV